LLSILIPTIPGRSSKLAALLSCLDPQVAARDDVELLVFRDNRRMTIGEKRNKLVQLAQGEYVAFVDDDDMVKSDYVEVICSELTQNEPDVLCFVVTVRGYGTHDKPCRYHPSFEHVTLRNEYQRKPNHLMVWKKQHAVSVPFPTINHGEDTEWASKMAAKAVHVSVISRALYVYQFDSNDNSTLNMKE